MDNIFDQLSEQVNDIINLNALISILANKGIIETDEFIKEKDKALKEFKEQYPTLFK